MDATKLEKIVKDEYRRLKQSKGYIGPKDLGAMGGDKMPSDQVRALIKVLAPLVPDDK